MKIGRGERYPGHRMVSEQKESLIQTYRRHATDSGSPEVQVAILTQRIGHLTGHLQFHRKDFHCQRGLLKLVGQRRRLLRYLAREDEERYRQLLAQLGLRR